MKKLIIGLLIVISISGCNKSVEEKVVDLYSDVKMISGCQSAMVLSGHEIENAFDKYRHNPSTKQIEKYKYQHQKNVVTCSKCVEIFNTRSNKKTTLANMDFYCSNFYSYDRKYLKDDDMSMSRIFENTDKPNQ